MGFTAMSSIASNNFGLLVVVLFFYVLGCDDLIVVGLLFPDFFRLVASERLGAFKLIVDQLVFGFSAPAAFDASAPIEVIKLLYSVRGSCRGLGPRPPPLPGST